MVKRICLGLLAVAGFGCVGNDSEQMVTSAESELTCLKNNINNADKCLSKEAQQRVGLKCQYVEVSGTRFKKKQCTTLAQRDSKQEDAVKQLRQMQGNGTSFPSEEGVQ